MNLEFGNTQCGHYAWIDLHPSLEHGASHVPLKVCFYMTVKAKQLQQFMVWQDWGSVLHHIGVTLSCVKRREEMFTLIDSRLVTPIQFIWKRHSVSYAFLKRATVKYLKHAERASLTDIQVVGRLSEVIMSDNVKGSRSDGTWYLCLFHFFQGEAPVPSCLLVSGQEMPDEMQWKVKHSSDI